MVKNLQERKKYNYIQHDTTKDGLLYKYCTVDTLFLILKNSNLYYSIANEFNDPFELTTQIFEGFDNEYLGRLFISKIDSRLLDKIDHFSTDYTQIIINAWKSLIPQIGISCFSKSPLVSLMWSHYANKHRGVCIGFNFDLEINSEKIIQMPVRYIENIEKCDFFNEENIVSGMMAYHWLLSKSKVWQYENEVRRINISKHGLLPIQLKIISEIYLGLNITVDEANDIREMLNNLKLDHVKIFQTKIIPSTYRIGI